MKSLNTFLIIIILSGVMCNTADASSEADTASDVLKFLSCETGYLGNWVEGNTHPYSCFSEPLIKHAALFGILGYSSFNTIARLKIYDEDIFPGNCARENRVDPKDPKLHYGFCNNILLLASNASAIFESASSGEWTFPDPSEYTIKFHHSSGVNSIMADLTFLPPDATDIVRNASGLPIWNLIYRVQKIQDKICVQMFVPILFSYISIGCKYIEEPYKTSVYDNPPLDRCDSTYNCSKNVQEASRTFTPVIATIVSCVRDVIISMLIDDQICIASTDEASELLGGPATTITQSSLIHQFQVSMRKVVTGFLTLYVFLFGCRLALTPETITQKDLVNFIFKFVLVTYFSIGINTNLSGNTRFDGMTQWIFPLLFSGLNDMTNWMMYASSINGLCNFADTPVTNNMNNVGLALWDQIDCRLAYYIGYDVVGEMMAGITWANDPVGHQIPPYILIVIPALFFGLIPLAVLAIYYPIMVISLVAYVIAMYINALIIISVLGVLAPLFVPMALFSYTYGYFTKWWRILFAMMIQPVIAMLFLSLFFAVFDRAFYGTCIYKPVNINYFRHDGDEITTQKNYRTFYISYDISDYENSSALDSCKTSLGSFLSGGKELNYQPPENIDIHTYENFKDQLVNTDSDVFNGAKRPRVEWIEGLFTKHPKLSWEALIEATKSFILCYSVLTAMRMMLDILPKFISDLSGSDIRASNAFVISNEQGSGVMDAFNRRAETGMQSLGRVFERGRRYTKESGGNLFERIGKGFTGIGRRSNNNKTSTKD